MANKIYVGNGKEKKFDQGSIISVTLDLDKLLAEYNAHGYVNKHGTRQIRIDVGTRRTVGEFGDTHAVTLNTWHPDSFQTPQPIQIKQGQKTAPPLWDDEGEPTF